MDIVLVHGYNVTSTRTYGVLPQRLKGLGFKVKDLYLSKYITLDDDLTLNDIIKGFNAALIDVYGSSLSKPFSCITHSTGGLVARGWIQAYYSDRMKSLPMKHLIMLAPPNNGSRLAGLGKSKLSRMRAILGVEPGLKVLDDLELGSEFQWHLNSSWMRKKLHAATGFFPFVMMGQWIDKKVWDVLVPATYERGSDGVVRAASANLNMKKVSIGSDGKVFREVMGAVPFLIPPKISHTDNNFGIVQSIPAKGDHPVLTALLSALSVKTRAQYNAVEVEFAVQTAQLQRQETFYDQSPLDRYCQLVFRMVDNMGHKLADFSIELLDGGGRGDSMPKGFLPNHHKNQATPEFFVFYLDYDLISKVKGGKLGFRIHAATGSALVTYPITEYVGILEMGVDIKPNQTTLIEVTLKRRLNKNVFQLTKNTSYQKIKPIPSKEWIE